MVNNIQEDEFGCLWLSGLHGIYRISRQQLNEVAAGRRSSVECLAYGEADGMLSSECNGGENQPAGCKDRKGRIWFPTMQGVVVVDPKEMRRTESAPPVVIEQVPANGEVIFGDGMQLESKVQSPKPKVRGSLLPDHQLSTLNYRLAPGHARVLEIHYTANSLVAPERVRFRYRLVGSDSDWLWDDQNRRVAFYTNLRPRDYTFQVSACNSHGTWNEHGDQFSFYVAPHLYETWPFYSVCGAVIVFAGPSLHYRRIRRLRHVQRLEQQRALHEERARIAKDLHDELGANLTGLALQLARLLVQQFQQSGQRNDEMAHLTPREEEVLSLAVKGYRSKEIADALSLSTQTVQTHFRNLYEKLHVRSRAEAVARYLGR